eukprot:Hpha_TRINITY_DN11588_c0_g1::TRINITY_DN11588_c0_g1_i1::g.32273::m.32273
MCQHVSAPTVPLRRKGEGELALDLPCPGLDLPCSDLGEPAGGVITDIMVPASVAQIFVVGGAENSAPCPSSSPIRDSSSRRCRSASSIASIARRRAPLSGADAPSDLRLESDSCGVRIIPLSGLCMLFRLRCRLPALLVVRGGEP